MKQQIVMVFTLLLSSFLASARLLVLPKQGCFLGICSSPPSPCQPFSLGLERLDIGEKKVKANDITVARSSAGSDDMELIGSEECNEKDEECFSRRMIAEAHLDYIYTQHHKP